MKRYLLPIIVSAVSLVVITVVTYAYFTATIDPSGETTATIRTATVGTVTFVTTSPTTNLENVLPGWEGTGSTTVYFNNNSDDDVAYHCTVSLENNSYATNVYIQTLSGSDAQVPTETALTSEGVTVSQGTLTAQSDITSPNHGAEHVVTYKIIFKEIGQAQNDDQGRTINTYTTCVIDQQSGSALTLVSGNITDLSGDPIANQPMVAFSSPTYFTTDANGHYEVRLASGAHNIYYVEGMTMQELQAEGNNIRTNENVITKSITVTDTNTQTLNIVMDINVPLKTVSVACTHCTSDSASTQVEVGGTASFTITADSGYTLEGATVSGGCTLNESTGALTLANVSDNTTCYISSMLNPYVYWSVGQGGSEVAYDASSKPTSTYDSLAGAGIVNGTPYIRTTVIDNLVQKHEACLNLNDNTFCMEHGAWTNKGYSNVDTLCSSMEEAFGISYSEKSSGVKNKCYFGGYFCTVDSSGWVACYRNSNNGCMVGNNGTARCD